MEANTVAAAAAAAAAAKTASSSNNSGKQAIKATSLGSWPKVWLWALFGLLLIVCLGLQQVAAGGKGKGGEEDIILYNGNIVMRGDKKGGSIVMANNHPSHEEVEFSPSFFTDDMGGNGFRRRR